MTLLGRQKCHIRRRISVGKAPKRVKEEADAGQLDEFIVCLLIDLE